MYNNVINHVIFKGFSLWMNILIPPISNLFWKQMVRIRGHSHICTIIQNRFILMRHVSNIIVFSHKCTNLAHALLRNKHLIRCSRVKKGQHPIRYCWTAGWTVWRRILLLLQGDFLLKGSPRRRFSAWSRHGWWNSINFLRWSVRKRFFCTCHSVQKLSTHNSGLLIQPLY